MLRAGTGGTAGQYLAALGEEAAKLGGVLVIYMLALIHAKLANLFALAVLVVLFLIECQGLFLLLVKFIKV